jgi:hypothetical protein
MNEYRGECVFCGKPVRGHAARELSVAWEVERHAGGANKITGPKEYSGRIAHPVCQSARATAERSGLSADQESLL